MRHRLVRFNKAGFVMFLRKHTTNTEPVRTDEGMLCCLFIFKLAIRREKSFLWRSEAASSYKNFLRGNVFLIICSSWLFLHDVQFSEGWIFKCFKNENCKEQHTCAWWPVSFMFCSSVIHLSLCQLIDCPQGTKTCWTPHLKTRTVYPSFSSKALRRLCLVIQICMCLQEDPLLFCVQMLSIHNFPLFSLLSQRC